MVGCPWHSSFLGISADLQCDDEISFRHTSDSLMRSVVLRSDVRFWAREEKWRQLCLLHTVLHHGGSLWSFRAAMRWCLCASKFPGCGQSAAMSSAPAVPSVNSWGGGSLYTVLLTIYCTVFVQFHIVQCSTIVIVCIRSSSHSSSGMTAIFCRVSCSYLVDGEISVWQRTLVTWLRISQAI